MVIGDAAEGREPEVLPRFKRRGELFFADSEGPVAVEGGGDMFREDFGRGGVGGERADDNEAGFMRGERQGN